MIRSGIRYYTSATVAVHFPEDQVRCAYCPLLETYARKQCRMTGEYIADDRTIGYNCPLQFEEEENEDISDAERIRD